MNTGWFDNSDESLRLLLRRLVKKVAYSRALAASVVMVPILSRRALVCANSVNNYKSRLVSYHLSSKPSISGRLPFASHNPIAFP